VNLLANLGTELVWQVVGSLVAALVALVAGLPLLRGAPAHPLRLLAGGLAAAALPLLLTRLLLVGWDEPGTELLRVTTWAAGFLFAPLTAGPALAATATLAALASIRSPSRAWWRGGALLLAGVGVAAALVGVGHATGNPYYADVRAVAYVVVAAGLAVGASGRAPDGGGDAASAAAAAFPLAVALGEASERGLVWLVASTMPPRVTPELWGVAVTRMRDAVATEWLASWGVFGVAALAGAAGIRREAWLRTGSAWGVAVVIGGALLWGSDLHAARLEVLSRVCTGVLP
jgi:hypothetical protein